MQCETNQHVTPEHLAAAADWDDADVCLQWAEEMQATVAEMKAWRRAQRGEDLSKPESENPGGDKPEGSPEPATAASARACKRERQTDLGGRCQGGRSGAARAPAASPAPSRKPRRRTRKPKPYPVPAAPAPATLTLDQRIDNFEKVLLGIPDGFQRVMIAARLRKIADQLEGASDE